MSKPTLTPMMEAANRVIDQSISAEIATTNEPGPRGVTARLRIAALPGVLRGLAAEADAATPPEQYLPAACAVLSSLAAAYAGYGTGGTEEGSEAMAVILLRQAADMIERQKPERSIGEVVDRHPRGRSQ